MAPGISDDDDPTVESLQRSKEDLFSEHLMTGRYDSSCTVSGEIWTAKLNFAGGYA